MPRAATFPTAPLLTTALVFALAISPTKAHADADPAHVETCTVAKAQAAGEECVLCRAYYRNPDHCKTSFRATTFAHRCRSAGASVWREVWCRPQSAGAAPLSDSAKAALLEPETQSAPAPSPSSSAPTQPTASTSEPAVPPASAAPTPAPAHAAEPTTPSPRAGACGSCAIGAASPLPPPALWAAGLPLALALTRYRRARSHRR